jgi:fumarate reductase subunit D
MSTSPRRWKRSNAPIFWAMFGGGGTLSSLAGPALVLITGLLVPLGLLASGTMSYARMLAFAQNPLGKLLLLAVVVLFAWHAVHRIYKSLHDFGIHPGPVPALACYGSAMVCTVLAAVGLLRVGF